MWSSEKTSVIVDKKGMAFANKLGTSVVTYTGASSLSAISTSATFEVLPVQSVRIAIMGDGEFRQSLGIGRYFYGSSIQ